MSPPRLNVITRMPEVPDPARPPLLLVHGAWHGAWCWQDHFMPFFAQHGYAVHALDLRGHGQSEAVRPMRWNRVSHYVDDVASVVRSFDAPPVVVGHSMGGFVVQHLLRRDCTLAGACLLATAPPSGVIRTTLKIVRTRPLDFLKAVGTLSLYPLVADPGAAKHMFFDADVPRGKAQDWAARLTDESFMAFLDMLALALPRGPVPDVPVLVVGGEKDTVFAPPSQAEAARKLGAVCKMVPGASHDVMLSRHWQVAAQHILDWMAAR